MLQYPALYSSAGRKSNNAQTLYLGLVAAEYFLLIVAAVLALNLTDGRGYFVLSALVILASLAVFLFRSWLKPEQDWYRARALAESIKTTSWRYCMRAEPFGSNDSEARTKEEFCAHLKAILDANRDVEIVPDDAAGDQITKSMEDIRALTLDERKQFYEQYRVREQRDWYVAKAKGNRASSRWWMWVGFTTYAIAIFLVLLRIGYPEQKIWPVEPFLVAASSILGWMQVKKFNELASSYTLTAHEIGLIQARIGVIKTDEQFAIFVNEAEQAFSREHTQWVARQQLQ